MDLVFQLPPPYSGNGRFPSAQFARLRFVLCEKLPPKEGKDIQNSVKYTQYGFFKKHPLRNIFRNMSPSSPSSADVINGSRTGSSRIDKVTS